MRKTFLYVLLLGIAAVCLPACENDDTDFFSQYTLTTGDDDTETTSDTVTVSIAWSASSVSVDGDVNNVVSASGADVVVNDTSSKTLILVLSGSTSDGSLLVYRSKKYTMLMNGVSITNNDGPAINNQCKKSLYIECVNGTANTLADGTSYASKDYDQKGALFSEGQIFFSGAGSLSVNGNCMNAIASDDYITIDDDITLNATTSATGTNGIKAKDGMYINGGVINVSVASDGGRGIRCEARTVITGGTTTITTSGDCLIETADGVADTTSAVGIKCDSLFTMSAGTLTITSTGDGGKGIRCDENVEFSGGTLVVKTTGSNDDGKPKGIKSDTGIIVSGGSFSVTVKKSWACDNGTDSETPADHLTVQGSPKSSSIEKKSVVIAYE